MTVKASLGNLSGNYTKFQYMEGIIPDLHSPSRLWLNLAAAEKWWREMKRPVRGQEIFLVLKQIQTRVRSQPFLVR